MRFKVTIKKGEYVLTPIPDHEVDEVLMHHIPLGIDNKFRKELRRFYKSGEEIDWFVYQELQHGSVGVLPVHFPPLDLQNTEMCLEMVDQMHFVPKTMLPKFKGRLGTSEEMGLWFLCTYMEEGTNLYPTEEECIVRLRKVLREKKIDSLMTSIDESIASHGSDTPQTSL